ncbi:MAG: hypothetical protein NVS4B11_02440 [Ktedonobacteraceae bacterium]
MAQHPTRSCPTCGMPVPGGQRFCSNCGSQLSAEGNKPTAPSGENPSEVSDMSTRAATPTPPPFDGPYTQYPQQTPPPPPPYQGQLSSQSPLAPAYATPQKGSFGRVWRNVGCGVSVVVLLLLVICSIVGYFVYNGVKSAADKATKTAQATGGYIGGSSDVTPTPQGTTTSTPIGSTITYASVDMTIVDVQQAQNFTDDSSSAQANGVARLDIKEQNTASRSADFLYSNIARLLLPDGGKVEPLNEHDGISPDASVSRANWLDFPVPMTTKANQLTLELGADDEAKMDIPLTGSADLAKYKPKTASPNKTMQYEGLNWTMTSAMSSWSNKAVQAKKGMTYITVSFTIDNPSQKDVDEYWNSYMRLKAGDTTSSPDSNTDFPLDFAAGSSGKTGSVVFLVPQGNTSYTFILLANSSNQINQVSTDFQIQ